jgi:hypothetical protein
MKRTGPQNTNSSNNFHDLRNSAKPTAQSGRSSCPEKLEYSPAGINSANGGVTSFRTFQGRRVKMSRSYRNFVGVFSMAIGSEKLIRFWEWESVRQLLGASMRRVKFRASHTGDYDSGDIIEERGGLVIGKSLSTRKLGLIVLIVDTGGVKGFKVVG